MIAGTLRRIRKLTIMSATTRRCLAQHLVMQSEQLVKQPMQRAIMRVIAV